MLEIRGLHHLFVQTAGNYRVIAQQLNLQVQPGEVVALMGPSGSGKTTLLKIIAGLLQPDAGKITWGHVDLAPIPTHKRQFALMFQDLALFPFLDVLDNVAFSLVEKGMRRAKARAAALEMLARVGLATHANERIWTLSGGEQQRVALARALISEPRLLLLDEPFSALDTHLKQSLREEFLQHIRSQSVATLLVTHDPIEAQAMADHIWHLSDGRLTRHR
jgi:ABC-type Fe3+/spermidine/putrescine transport system ATPase subunit